MPIGGLHALQGAAGRRVTARIQRLFAAPGHLPEPVTDRMTRFGPVDEFLVVENILVLGLVFVNKADLALSRYSAASGARLSGFPFESRWAFPA